MAGGERFAAREPFGSWMPSMGSDSDLRRVLYGMAGTFKGGGGSRSIVRVGNG